MADKDVDGVIDALASASSVRGARVVATTVDAPRALPAGDLAARWRALAAPASLAAVTAVDDPIAAIDEALAASTGTTVVAGSLYLVGAARAYLVEDPELRDPQPASEPVR
jgi:dihydrofolate synthase/folylpolyglutamate synthase